VPGGERAALEVLELAPDTTAVIAYNDLMAIGALRALRQRGRRVPADASVIGFDDIAVAAYVDPPLTTIAQRTDEMGRWAVGRLTGAVNGADTVRLPVELRVRESTGPAPADPRRQRLLARVLDADLGGLARDDRPADALARATDEHLGPVRDAGQPDVLDGERPGGRGEAERAGRGPHPRAADARPDERREQGREECVAGARRIDLVLGGRGQVAERLGRAVLAGRDEQAAVAALGDRAVARPGGAACDSSPRVVSLSTSRWLKPTRSPRRRMARSAGSTRSTRLPGHEPPQHPLPRDRDRSRRAGCARPSRR
jgi:hypothetical protein